MAGFHMREKTWFRLIMLGWLYVVLVATLVPSLCMDVKSVEVSSAATPEYVTMRADRTIERPFIGLFVVTLRRSPSQQFVCSTGSSKPINYRPAAELPDPLYLWWWFGSKANLKPCEDEGFGPGEYLLETCWTVIPPFWGLVPEKH